MATLFRAVVMLVVLVGLPSAWVYYGPLPPAAMGVVQRTIAAAKQSFGLAAHHSDNTWQDKPSRTAPRFDASLATATGILQKQSADLQAAKPLPPVNRDSQFSLASATIPVARQPAGPQKVPVHSPAVSPTELDQKLAKQLEPHLSLLRSQGAAEYTLENWGGGGQFYRFRCAIAWGESEDYTRQFEAIAADPMRAVYQVVGEVTAWQNARGANGAHRWQ